MATISGRAFLLSFATLSLLSIDTIQLRASGLNDRFGGTGRNLPASDIVGATPGAFGVGSSGEASYSIPITVPAGTTGLQPKLTLDYSSRGGKGVRGFGGSIGGLSSISRCGSDLYHDGVVKAVDFSVNDKFCLNGQRLVPVSGTYGADGAEYRTELEEFSKVVSYGSAGSGPQYFKVWRKSGEILEYGNTTDSRALALGRSEARAWAMNKLSDTAGNYETFSYFNDSTTGDFGLTRVDYTGNAAQGLTPYNSVQFVYETHPTPQSSYIAGQKYSSAKRLTNVKVYADTTLFRDYRLAYRSANQLNTITECTASQCLTPTTFSWKDNEGLADGKFPFSLIAAKTAPYTNFPTGCGYDWCRDIMAIGDFNGDGRTDFLYAGVTSEGSVGNNGPTTIMFGQPDGSFVQGPVNSIIPRTYKVIASGNFGGKGGTDLYAVDIDSYSRRGTRATDEYVLLSNGDGTFNTITIPYSSGKTMPAGYSVVASGNFRGNGLTDLYLMNTNTAGYKQGTGSDLILRANGDGTFTKVDTGTNIIAQTAKVLVSGDFNGDGLVDFYTMMFDSSYNTKPNTDKVFLSKGDGTFNIITPTNTLGQNFTSTTWSTIDINGDGLSDIYAKWGSQNAYDIYIAKGDGSFQRMGAAGTQWSTSFMAPISNPNYSYSYNIISTGDFDGDGKTDFYGLGGYVDTSNTCDGDGNCSTPSYPVPDTLFLSNGDGTYRMVPRQDSDPYPGDKIGSYIRAAGDIKGNGATNLFWSQGGTYKYDLTEQVQQPKNPQLVSQITNGLNNTIQLDYKPLTDASIYTKYTDGVYPVQDVVNSSLVVSQVRTENGIGGRNSQSYKYAGLKQHVTGAGSLGFAKMTVTDDTTGIVTESAYNQYWDQRTQGELGHSQTVTSGGTVLEEKTVFWASSCQGATEAVKRCFKYSPQTVTKKKDLNGADLGTVTENSTYDAYGFVAASSTITTQGSNTYTKTTANTYTHNATNWILGRLTAAQVTHSATGQSDQIRKSAFTYDSVTGLLASETIEPGNALSTTKAYTRNGYGAVTGVTESWTSDGTVTTPSGSAISSRTSTVTYDARMRYKVSETNPLGQTQTSTYDAVHGLPLSTTGPNGLATTWTYNAWGQAETETRADNTVTRNYRYNCTTSTVKCPTNAAYASVSIPDGKAATASFKDKLHRTIRESVEGFDGRFVDVDTAYNGLGQVIKRAEPAYQSDTQYWSSVTYDLLGRPLVTTKPDNKTETVSYNGLTITSTNGLGQTKTITHDVLGRMATSTDVLNQSVTYVYDAIGQLVRMTDPVGNVTTTSYNIRGNKIAMTDPDKGSWSYSYNPLGQLKLQTDAKGQTIAPTYDALGRMLTRIDTDAGGVLKSSSWVYDTATKGIGKLASEAGYGYSAAVSYDSLGRPLAKTETMDDGSAYTVTNSYDAQGRIATTAYPTGLTVQSLYTPYGQLSQLKNATSGTSYWQATAADARGNVTASSLGNGVSEVRAYDATTGFLTRINSFGATAGTVQDLTYSFDTQGNLLSRADAKQAISEAFVYDTLNRVTSSTLTASGQNTAITVAYNGIGNITSKSDIGSYTYGPNTTSCGATAFAGPHAVSNVAGQKVASYCYDANGNLTAGDTRNVTWSAFNMPTLMSQGTRSIEVAYGPDRDRFKRIDRNETGTTTTYYVAGGSHEIVKQGSTIKAKTTIGGIAVVTETITTPTATETLYLHHDHLGSTDVVTDATGAVTDRFSFDAWGKRRNVTWAAFVGGPPATLWQMQKTTRGYTGHEQLDPIGLIHMNARVYDPELGRFLSADSVIQNPSDLQSLNRYSYVQNNPLSFTDPTGHFLSGLFKAIGSFFGNVFKAIGQVFKAILSSSIFRSLLQLAICASPLVGQVACAATGALLTLASGGSIGDAVKSFAFAIISVNVWGGTGDALTSAGTGLGGSLTRVLVHGVVGGALSVAQGGNFLQGFVSASAGQAAGLAVGTGTELGSVAGDAGRFLRTFVVAATGGTASVLTGGKFANGAITAGFAHLFNDEAHDKPKYPGDNFGPKVSDDEATTTNIDEIQAPRFSLIRALLGRFPLASVFIPSDQLGGDSIFEDITKPGSTTNYQVNMSQSEFENNLTRDGFTGTPR